jgi:RimJ/RimL family protein N-acetyltransferase
MKANTPTLDGTRIRLEPLTLAHLPALEAVALDPEANEQIWRYMLSKPKTPHDLRVWADAALAAEAAGTSMPWVTVLKANSPETREKVIGSTRYLELDQTHKTVEVGHTWLHPAFHGSGANAEAKFLQLRYAFEELYLNRVALKTHHENLQSQAAMRKLGAVYEGTFRNHYIMPDGSLRHSVWFSITREDWPEVKAKLERRVIRANASAKVGPPGPPC